MLKRLLFLILVAPSLMAYDICEEINSLANDWNEVANFIDEFGDEPLTDRDFRTLENYVTELAVDTYELADALIDLGNNKETRLGTSIRKSLASLQQANDTDSAVRHLDRLVDSIDRTTDYCDQQ